MLHSLSYPQVVVIITKGENVGLRLLVVQSLF